MEVASSPNKPGSAGGWFPALVKSMRPAQWIKNLFVFAGLVFAERLGDWGLTVRAVQAFAVFCMVSSAVYLFNDLRDIDSDRGHPVKRRRPLASGALSPALALAAAVVLAAGGLAWAFVMGERFLPVAAAYLVLMVLYSLWLKAVVILDVMVIAMGFVLRVVAGTVAVGVATSDWLLVCTFLLSLFLGFAKRRHELLLLEQGAVSHRSVLAHYNPYFLDQMIGVVTASTVICYTLYTLSPRTVEHVGSTNLLYSLPFVIYGIFRYLYLIHRKEGGGDPTHAFFSDPPLMLAVLLWLVTVVIVLYNVN